VPVSTVAVSVVLPPSGALDGTTRHVAFAGAPTQAKVALPGTPAAELSSSGYTADSPLLTVTLLAPLAFSVKSTPTPCSGIVCGDPAASSATEIDPVAAPAAVGAKTTWKVQAPPAATLAPQVFELAGREKSPLAVTPPSSSGDPPSFESVTVCALEVRLTPVAGKINPAPGESDTPGGARPLPESVTVCERNWSDTVSTPDVLPTAAGLEATEIPQLEWPFSAAPHPFIAVKLPPLTCTAISVSALSPVFVSVTVCGELAV
jgi:hypothetical protein